MVVHAMGWAAIGRLVVLGCAGRGSNVVTGHIVAQYSLCLLATTQRTIAPDAARGREVVETFVGQMRRTLIARELGATTLWLAYGMAGLRSGIHAGKAHLASGATQSHQSNLKG